MNFSAAMPGWGDGVSVQAWMRQWQALFAPLAQTPWSGMAAAMPGFMSAWVPGMVPGMTAHPGSVPPPPMDIWHALFSSFGQLAAEGYAQARQAAATMMPPTALHPGMAAPDMRAFWQGLRAHGGLPEPDTALREALDQVPVGPLREHLERWQHTVRAQLDYQHAASEFGALLRQITQQALTRFEQRLAARAESGEPIQTPRALFDEWIEAGEAVWAECANSETFITTFGRYGNAELRLRAALQDQLNRTVEAMGLPTRSEVDADHRRIAQLERELRRLQAQHAQSQHGSTTLGDTAESGQHTKAEADRRPRPAPAKSARAARVAADVTAASHIPKTIPASSRRATTKPAKTLGPKPSNPVGKTPVVSTPDADHRRDLPAPRRATTPLKRRKARRVESPQTSVNVLPQVAPPRAFGIEAPGGKNGKRKKQGARA